MENNSNEVVEIDLKDLMFAVLHKWRPVLAVAVIMAAPALLAVSIMQKLPGR